MSQFLKFLLVIVSAWSANGLGYTDFSSDSEWQSTQIHALGGSAILSEELSDQILLNPSMVQKRTGKFETQLFNLNVMGSKDAFAAYKNVTTVSSNNSSNSSAKKLISIYDALSAKNLSAAVSFSIFASRLGGFYLLPYSHANVSAAIDVPAWPEGNVFADSYAGLVAGYSFEWRKKLAFAAAIRPGVRTTFAVDANLASLNDFQVSSGSQSSSTGKSSGSASTGVYVPLDIHGSYYMPMNFTGILGVRNLFDSRAVVNARGAKAQPIPMKVNLGVAHAAWAKGVQRVRWYSEIQDVSGVFAESGFWYRWLMGAQYLVRFPSRLSTSFGLHTGLRSGYPSIGATVDLYLIKLEASLFTRELGTRIGQRPERCYTARAYSSMTF
jgi:hypothetical protein